MTMTSRDRFQTLTQRLHDLPYQAPELFLSKTPEARAHARASAAAERLHARQVKHEAAAARLRKKHPRP